MVIGGMIYLLWRSDDMLMFKCADAVGLSGLIYSARGMFGSYSEWVPNIILFSLPDAVWVYSGTAFFSRLWESGPRLPHLFWSLIFVVLAVGGELGQIINIVPGTFDWIDLWMCVLAFAASYKIGTKI